MDTETQNTINEQLEKLPIAIRNAIATVGLRERFLKITRGRGLRIDQAGSAEDEMMLVLIGLEHPDRFIDNLVKNVGLDRTTASDVAADINNSIFKEIRHLLIEMHEKDRLTEEMLQEPATQGGPSALTQAPSSIPTVNQQPPTQPLSTTQNIPRTLGSDMTQVKMDGTFRLAPDAVTVKAPTPTIPKPTPVAPVRDGKYASADPYREPVN